MKKNWSLAIISFLIVLIIALLFYIVIDKKDREESNEKNYIANNTIMNISKKETKDEITYEIIDNSKNLTYSWTFEKNEDLANALKDNMEIDLNLELDVIKNLEDEELNKLITNEDSLIISFEHHGELPTKAKIKIDVTGQYKEGESLYLYYLNEEKTQVEYIKEDIIVKNGIVEFEIDHCSNYFLTASIVQDAVNNPKNVNLIIVVMVVVIIVLIGATLFQNKK